MSLKEKLRILLWPGRLPQKYQSITHVTAFSTGLSSFVGALWILDSQDPYRYLYLAITIITGTYLGRFAAVEVLDHAPNALRLALKLSAAVLSVASLIILLVGVYLVVATGTFRYLSMAIAIATCVTLIFKESGWSMTVAYVDLGLSLISILIFVHEPNLISGISAALCAAVTSYYFGKTEHLVQDPAAVKK
jgi:hypothetical protein